MPKVHLLDYVAGNVRSLMNAIEKVGFQVQRVEKPTDIESAECLILPGVGHFGHCLSRCASGGYLDPVRKHIRDGKPFMGICVGMQALFEGSTESAEIPGLGIIPGQLSKLDNRNKSVPHIGWSSAATVNEKASTSLYGLCNGSKYYYAHSYAMHYDAHLLEGRGWHVAKAIYGDEEFVGAIARSSVLATQFHPEKSGQAGLRVLRAFLQGQQWSPAPHAFPSQQLDGPTCRIIACLDVRSNDEGDLVVTKGDQYDVREKTLNAGENQVRNLGKPVDMARKYYEQDADEITFLNITSFRNVPSSDLPMLEVLRLTAENVFVPLIIGGGIRDIEEPGGTIVPANEIAKLYFNSGADKVSIGSEAVTIAEQYLRDGRQRSGKSAIETISAAYGAQAVIVSVDPRRVYVRSPVETNHHTIKTAQPGPSGENFCWYQCTTKGGREGRDLDVRQLVTAVEELGAGELLLNCIDRDGSNAGFDLELINDVKQHVKIPVIASSGAGKPLHFKQLFQHTSADAALGAGMFHRGEYTVKDVKDYLGQCGLPVRPSEHGP